MMRTRVIPTLLIHKGGLVKTVQFAAPRYVGDPVNAIRIFNEKEVDELAVIDIDATILRREPQWDLISRISKEAFMPLSYGGGLNSVETVAKVLSLGYEKVIINSHALTNPGLITDASATCGSQSIVVCIDVKTDVFGRRRIYSYREKKPLQLQPTEWAVHAEKAGAGELLINSVDREGTYRGYDIRCIRDITAAVKIPVIALGGAAAMDDFVQAAKEGGASAVAAGSMFVFYGPRKAVLITYPDYSLRENVLP
jgi:imidazole glycerol-phosphate synthase subunit HisF